MLKLKEFGDNNMENKSQSNVVIKYRDDYYDITKFIHKHPGGTNTLKGLSNTDVTKRFLNAPPHSDAAMYLMNDYKIKENLTKNGHNVFKSSNNLEINNNDSSSDINLKNSNELNTNPLQDNFSNNKEKCDESMEHLVDWSKPMLGQIYNISKYYDEWVHKPVDKELRIFGPWYLEMLTKTSWWIVLLFWIPIICYILYSEIYSPENKLISGNKILIQIAIGIFLWTFIEYTLHRWVFHVKISPNNKKLCVFHFIIHGLHHKVPFDPYRLVFPPFPAVILASILYLPVLALFPYPRITFSGGLIGYLCYDMMHYYLHYGNPYFWHMYQMKRYHNQHHFAHQNIGFGITSPLWDVIFKTKICLRSLKFKIRW